MLKNASSSTPMRPTINIQHDSYEFSEDVLKSPSAQVAMDVSNVVTPYQPKSQQQAEKRTKKWAIDDFNIGRRLGEGSYSTVILVEEKKTGFLCALKVIKVTSPARRLSLAHSSFRCRSLSFGSTNKSTS